MIASSSRKVYIDTLSHNGKLLAYVVCYLVRTRHQRYYAAQFDPAIGLEGVRSWVSGQDKLELVNKPNSESSATF